LNPKKTLRVTSAMGPFYRKTCMVNRRKYVQLGRKLLRRWELVRNDLGIYYVLQRQRSRLMLQNQDWVKMKPSGPQAEAAAINTIRPKRRRACSSLHDRMRCACSSMIHIT
jgi:hypothetical protein